MHPRVGQDVAAQALITGHIARPIYVAESTQPLALLDRHAVRSRHVPEPKLGTICGRIDDWYMCLVPLYRPRVETRLTLIMVLLARAATEPAREALIPEISGHGGELAVGVHWRRGDAAS